MKESNDNSKSNDFSLDCQLPMKNEKYMIFKGKNYPIDLKILQAYSLFFSKQHFLQNEQFLLFDYPSFITEYSFDSFINACQNKRFKIDQNNVISLHYLSIQFEVPILKNKVEEYIEKNHKKLLIECLQYKIFHIEEVSKSTNFMNNDDNNKFYDITYEIEAFGESFKDYLEKEIIRNFFMSLPIPIVYKILQHFILTHPQDISNLDLSKIQANSIFNFLFEYFEKNGKSASVIFALFNMSNEDIKKN